MEITEKNYFFDYFFKIRKKSVESFMWRNRVFSKNRRTLNYIQNKVSRRKNRKYKEA